ncbi:FtsX-like permease family protein [Sinomonas sp. JGH33]|uniref:FtsX-like permease family protein n=1 Tax=Sinomonas terricola TaxID=3110330 RepID=A0ABU5T3M2_9MICC|nr:FtsX-like permease family protein [Sinomonas sp. JGH33]MEA5454076.1 FtsX-like permease family protein [Sinomonas sp. JGH33]
MAGVAVMVATFAGIGVVERSMKDGVASLGGFGQLGVVPDQNGGFLTKEEVRSISGLPGVGLAIPTASARTVIRLAGSEREASVMVTGYPTEFNDRVSSTIAEGRLPRDGVPEVLLPRDIALDLKADVGDDVEFAGSGGPVRMTVVGIADPKRLGVLAYKNVFSGMSVVQELFGLGGKYTRIDLLLQRSTEEWTEANRHALPSSTKLQDTRTVTSALDPILATLRVLLTGLAVIMLALGSLLGTIAYTEVMERRQTVYGTLRSVGATRGWIARRVLVEAFSLSVLAALAGVGLGAVGAFALYGVLNSLAGSDPVPAWPEPIHLLIAAGLGIAAGLLGAVRAVVKVGLLPPILLAQQEAGAPNRRGIAPWVGAGFMLLAGASLIYPAQLAPVVGLGATLIAAGCLASGALPAIARLGTRRWTRAVSALHLRRRGNTRAVASISGVVVAVVVSLFAGAAAVTETATSQIGRQFGADVQVSAMTGMTSSDVRSMLAGLTGVRSVAVLRTGQLSLATDSFQCECNVLAVEPSVYFDSSQLLWRDGNDTDSPRRLAEGGAIALPAGVAQQAGVRSGDHVEVHRGEKRLGLTVAGTFTSLVTGNQVVVASTDAAQLGITAATGWNIAADNIDAAVLRERVATALKAYPGISVVSASMMKERAVSQLLGYTASVFVVALVLAVFAGVAASAAFAANARRRRTEIAVLRAVGAPPRSPAALVLADALNVGGAAALAGSSAGVVGGFFVTRLVGSSLGVLLEWRPPVLAAILVASATVPALALAAMTAVARVRRIEPIDALRREAR